MMLAGRNVLQFGYHARIDFFLRQHERSIMPTFQDPLGISVQTPLGPEAFFLSSFRGREEISGLFHFQLELLAENRLNVAFDKLIGQLIGFSVAFPDGKNKRHFCGICRSLIQEERDSTFTTYRMEIVPQAWLLTKRVQSRIFQHETVPDILKKVLAGLDIKLEMTGTFEKRDYCVQYQESDFDFASRLMEEEGIFYFFKFGEGTHQMILANSPQSHPDAPFAASAIYEELHGGNRTDMRVTRWQKSQELRSGKYTVWDHCFELPGANLEAQRPTIDSVEVGKVAHKLKLAANEGLEIYEYPGAFAQRFDGVNAGGGDQAADLQKIFQDNRRTVAIRMEQEAAASILIRGSGDCRQFMAGHRFSLERHFNADGKYIITSVEHNASSNINARSGGSSALLYQNHFTALPIALPYRPQRKTPKPKIAGPQTAVVVGPPGEIIFCDKYGRVKVQFHWDRQGKKDLDSSCWIRASQNWGGAGWGGHFIPHVGQEMIVEFEEGDPDRPIITGRVYNAECMPPLELPANKTKSVLRDHGGNEMILEGHGGVQQIAMFSPLSNTKLVMGNKSNPPAGFALLTDANETKKIGLNQAFEIGINSIGKIGANRTFNVGANETVTIGGSQTVTITGKQTETVLGKSTITVAGKRTETYGGAQNITNPKLTVSTAGKTKITAGSKLTEGSPKIEVLAATSLMMASGGKMDIKAKGKLNQESGAAMNVKSKAKLNMESAAVMNIKSKAALNAEGTSVNVNSKGEIKVKGSIIKLNSPTKVKGNTLTVE